MRGGGALQRRVRLRRLEKQRDEAFLFLCGKTDDAVLCEIALGLLARGVDIWELIPIYS